MIRIFFILLCLSVEGCASSGTRFTGYLDPEYHDTPPIKNIAVIGKFDDLGIRAAAEYHFVRQLERYANPLTGIDLFPPTRQFTEDQILSDLKRWKAQALLVIAPKRFWDSVRTSGTSGVAVENPWIPFITHTRNNATTASITNMLLETRLIDISNGKTIWIGTARIADKGAANLNDGFYSISSSAVSHLHRTGVIR